MNSPFIWCKQATHSPTTPTPPSFLSPLYGLKIGLLFLRKTGLCYPEDPYCLSIHFELRRNSVKFDNTHHIITWIWKSWSRACEHLWTGIVCLFKYYALCLCRYSLSTNVCETAHFLSAWAAHSVSLSSVSVDLFKLHVKERRRKEVASIIDASGFSLKRYYFFLLRLPFFPGPFLMFL